jgi:hypothetical protein
VAYGGFEEIKRLKHPPVEALIKLVMYPLAWYLRQTEFDKAAYINNWMMPTNLYPSIESDQIKALCAALPKWFPDRAIVFRSVDSFRNPQLYQTLKALGYKMVLSRQVWYLDPVRGVSLKVHREDIRAARKNGHVESAELRDEEIARGIELYNKLYTEKYSRYNPQFTTDFLRRMRDENLLNIKTIRKDGKVNALMGYFVRNGVMTPPLYGYDTGMPKDNALYRQLTVMTMREAYERGLLLHDSAGVGKFKKKRGTCRVIGNRRGNWFKRSARWQFQFSRRTIFNHRARTLALAGSARGDSFGFFSVASVSSVVISFSLPDKLYFTCHCERLLRSNPPIPGGCFVPRSDICPVVKHL